jgi:hypothetical protein
VHVGSSRTLFATAATLAVYTKLPPPPPHLRKTCRCRLGPFPSAPITLIEPHCRYCALSHEQLDPLYRRPLAESTLKLIFVDLIVHPDALAAHQRLHCACKQLGGGTYDLLAELCRAYLKEGQRASLRCYGSTSAPTRLLKTTPTGLCWLPQRGAPVRHVGTPAGLRPAETP